MAKRGRPALPPSEQELEFQNAWEDWEKSNYTDKKAWDRMWIRVREACLANAKKMCKGINNPELEFRAEGATVYYMDYFKRKHVRPIKLGTFVYLGVKGWIYGIKQQREDAELCYEDYEKFEDIYTPETIRGIYRPELDVDGCYGDNNDEF